MEYNREKQLDRISGLLRDGETKSIDFKIGCNMISSNVFASFKKIIEQDSKGYYLDYLKAREKVSKSSAYYKGEPVGFLYQGYFLSRKDMDKLNKLVVKLSGILDKVINEYRKNGEFRSYFLFPPLMEELILLDPGYKVDFPMARFDLFYKPDGQSKFCELNADGSSAMNEVRVIQQIMQESNAFKELKKEYQLEGFELFYSWIEAIIKNYREYNNGLDDNPNIAIVDFKNEGTLNEFREFQQRFNERGYKTIICDPRELVYKNGRLYYQELHIKLVYRRATTIRLIEEADSIKDFLKAYRDGAVCVVGGLVSQVIHNKILFAILHNDSMVPFLDKDEQDFVKKTIPFTKVFNSDDKELLREVIKRRVELILKPFDKAASKGVYVGRDYTDEKWKGILKDITAENYIVQEFMDIPQQLMTTCEDNNLYFENYGYLMGMFMYNKKLAGLYTRAGRKNIIGSVAESFTVPNYLIYN